MFSSSNPHSGINRVCAVAYVIAAVLAAMTLSAWRASADTIGTPPTVDCVHVAAHSTNAITCRARGWHINEWLAVGPRGVVRRSSLPHCAYDDGSGRRPCSWNFDASDGNGRGLAFWQGKRIHYVWAHNPTGHGWHWVHLGLAGALDESDEGPRRWGRCVVKWGDTTRVRCADGTVVTS